jgi:peptide/nickel transport system substrate-binding protein
LRAAGLAVLIARLMAFETEPVISSAPASQQKKRGRGMGVSRRRVVQGALASGTIASVGLPRIGCAQAVVPASQTIRAVMQGDLRSFDPIWTTANITAYHGALIYDMLFSIDAAFKPQPQMVDTWTVSDDKLTYTFKLRDGLAWHDGTPVTAADCVASIRRWAARDGGGQVMLAQTRAMSVKDPKTFTIELSSPFGLVVEVLAKQSTPVCFMMPLKDAQTDPNQQISGRIGSGPFIFNAGETRPGNRYVYDRNTRYVPRKEPASGMAGGKVAKVARVILENLADDQTALAALQTGEIDFFEVIPIDFLPQVKDDPNITVEILNKTGNMGFLGMNNLHPPFDNVKARQAMLYLVNQSDFMKASFGDPKYYRTCGSYFGCGTDMENDANTGWFKAAPDKAMAKKLFMQSGYAGKPVVILQPTNFAFMNNAATILGQELTDIGVKVDLAASDWGGVITRRAVQAPVDKGGWDIFTTFSSGYTLSNPVSYIADASNGTNAWFGWPTDALNQQLRTQWAAAPTLAARQAIARKIQENAWNFVPHAFLGQWVSPVAHRSTVTGWLAVPEIIPFWNVSKS